jgi:hypothetical protein
LEAGVVKAIRISDSNGGTLVGVSQGVSWFFQQVSVGIIIEDDLVLEPSLLQVAGRFSSFLESPQVLSIGLHNSVPRKSMKNPEQLFRVSHFVISWGWVTTRESWNNRVKSYSEINYFSLFTKMIRKIGISSSIYHIYYYRRNLQREKVDATKCNWDDLWQINCFMKELKVITLNRNLVNNIGFGSDATNTFHKKFEYALDAISSQEILSIDFCGQLPPVDKKAERHFIQDRKISSIVRTKLKIRTRISGFRNKLKNVELHRRVKQ